MICRINHYSLFVSHKSHIKNVCQFSKKCVSDFYKYTPFLLTLSKMDFLLNCLQNLFKRNLFEYTVDIHKHLLKRIAFFQQHKTILRY